MLEAGGIIKRVTVTQCEVAKFLCVCGAGQKMRVSGSQGMVGEDHTPAINHAEIYIEKKNIVKLWSSYLALLLCPLVIMTVPLVLQTRYRYFEF